MNREVFQGRKLCIATKHGKEAAIASTLASAFDIQCFTPNDFDTDQLGTFSGEIERSLSPIEAARKKCQLAMDLTNCDLALASEGSFGRHPTLLFVPADEEFLLLTDRKIGIEIVARHLTTETNFVGANVPDESALLEFAEEAQFPEHALILKDREKEWSFLRKGIQSQKELIKSYRECASKYGQVFAETDMRAMLNPTRMKAITATTELLVQKMQSLCPNCELPGFDVVENQSGLPCEQCSMPTKSILNAVYRCAHCNFAQIEKYPKGKKHEDPMYCDFCNP
ncbi:MAG: hypothetical protein Crog4KO_19660 [Crocinitomicaceae bacterium]